jgi:hypothetical protein
MKLQLWEKYSLITVWDLKKVEMIPESGMTQIPITTIKSRRRRWGEEKKFFKSWLENLKEGTRQEDARKWRMGLKWILEKYVQSSATRMSLGDANQKARLVSNTAARIPSPLIKAVYKLLS